MMLTSYQSAKKASAVFPSDQYPVSPVFLLADWEEKLRLHYEVNAMGIRNLLSTYDLKNVKDALRTISVSSLLWESLFIIVI